MKGCFRMKSKKQQQKQKPLTSVKEHQFKRSGGNRLPTGRLATTTVTKSPSIWKRMFKRKTLPSK